MRTGAACFLASWRRQAVGIARRSGKPVRCVETQNVVSPQLVNELRYRPKSLPRRCAGKAVRIAKNTLGNLKRKLSTT